MLLVPFMDGLAVFHSKLYALLIEDKIEPEDLINAWPNFKNRCNFEETELLDSFD